MIEKSSDSQPLRDSEIKIHKKNYFWYWLHSAKYRSKQSCKKKYMFPCPVEGKDGKVGDPLPLELGLLGLEFGVERLHRHDKS